MDPTGWAPLIKEGGLFATTIVALVWAYVERQRANTVQEARDADQRASIEALVKATVAMEATAKSNENVVNIVSQVQREIIIGLGRGGRAA